MSASPGKRAIKEGKNHGRGGRMVWHYMAYRLHDCMIDNGHFLKIVQLEFRWGKFMIYLMPCLDIWRMDFTGLNLLKGVERR